MVVVAVGTLIKHINKMTKEELIGVEHLEGYGIACTGDGTIGVYKLDISFGVDEIKPNGDIEFNRCSSTKFITKVEMATRNRVKAAVIVDFTLNHYNQ